MKSTKKEVIELYQALNGIVNRGNAKFKYAVLKNLKIINNDIESLKTVEKEIEEVSKVFIEERNALISKYGTDTGAGMKSVEKDNENYDLVISEINALVEVHKETLELQNTKQVEYMNLLDEEYEIDFKVFEINIDNAPEDLDEKVLKVLMDFEIIK